MTPFLLRDRFLGTDVAEALLAQLTGAESRFQESTVYRQATGERAIDINIRNSRLLRDFVPLRAVVAARVEEVLDEVAARLLTTPIGDHEAELEAVWSGDGCFFAPHTDTLTGVASRRSHRVLSFVYYLHSQPRSFEGGALRLLPLLPGGAPTDIEPKCDRLVAFPSFLPHEVLPVRSAVTSFGAGRFSVNCWIRSLRPDRKRSTG